MVILGAKNSNSGIIEKTPYSFRRKLKNLRFTGKRYRQKTANKYKSTGSKHKIYGRTTRQKSIMKLV